jgi:hypothetical protein
MLPPLAVVACDAVEEVCRRRVRRGALAPDHAQLTAATSVTLQSCPPKRPCQAREPRLSCGWFFRPLQGGMRVSPGTAWGTRLGHSGRQRWRATGLGPLHGEDDSGGMLGVPAGPAEASGSLGCAPCRARGWQPPSPGPLLASAPACLRPVDGAGPIVRGLADRAGQGAPASDDLRQH